MSSDVKLRYSIEGIRNGYTTKVVILDMVFTEYYSEYHYNLSIKHNDEIILEKTYMRGCIPQHGMEKEVKELSDVLDLLVDKHKSGESIPKNGEGINEIDYRNKV